MGTRIIAGLVAAVIAIVTVLYFPTYIILPMVMFICGVATHEFLHATNIIRKPRILVISILISISIPAIAYFGNNTTAVYALVFLTTMYIFAEIFVDVDNIHFSEMAQVLFGCLIVPYFITALMRILLITDNRMLVFVPMICAWGSDTMAYVFGKAIGRHKLAPALSPKKTVEGSIGGIVGAVLGLFLYTTIFGTVNFDIIQIIVIGTIGSIIGQVGDISFSSIKRNYKIKDYGHIMPGHGGVLDRFDSIIFVAPAIEILFILFGV